MSSCVASLKGGLDGTTSCSVSLLNQVFFLVYLVVALCHVVLGCNVSCHLASTCILPGAIFVSLKFVYLS